MAEADRFAALDLGTNHCRLLIASLESTRLVSIERYSRQTRLGEGLVHTKRLSPRAMQRTMSVLHACAQKIRAHDVARLRCVSTAACREAENGAAFVTRIRIETGLSFEIIDRQEESALSALGCMDLLDPGLSYALIFDVGGGSTEMALAAREETPAGTLIWRTVEFVSVSEGTVTLSERFCQANRAIAYQKMNERVNGTIAQFVDRVGQRIAGRWEEVQLIGNSGTITTLAGIYLGLKRYRRDRVDGVTVPLHRLRELIEQIGCDPTSQHHGVLLRDRCPNMMAAGCAILNATITPWLAVANIRIADRGLRDGIIRSLCAHG